MARTTVDNRLDALYIGLPHSVGTSVGMGDLDPKSNALAANIALSHWLHLQSIGETPKLGVKTPDTIIANPDWNCKRYLQKT